MVRFDRFIRTLFIPDFVHRGSGSVNDPLYGSRRSPVHQGLTATRQPTWQGTFPGVATGVPNPRIGERKLSSGGRQAWRRANIISCILHMVEVCFSTL